ncbi:hypothetical protein M885DRAFT_611131, partial [Pelagophyceae sp. CCMP2097]
GGAGDRSRQHGRDGRRRRRGGGRGGGGSHSQARRAARAKWGQDRDDAAAPGLVHRARQAARRRPAATRRGGPAEPARAAAANVDPDTNLLLRRLLRPLRRAPRRRGGRLRPRGPARDKSAAAAVGRVVRRFYRHETGHARRQETGRLHVCPDRAAHARRGAASVARARARPEDLRRRGIGAAAARGQAPPLVTAAPNLENPWPLGIPIF